MSLGKYIIGTHSSAPAGTWSRAVRSLTSLTPRRRVTPRSTRGRPGCTGPCGRASRCGRTFTSSGPSGTLAIPIHQETERDREGDSERERERERERASERARERESERASESERERERERVCVREREREGGRGRGGARETLRLWNTFSRLSSLLSRSIWAEDTRRSFISSSLWTP